MKFFIVLLALTMIYLGFTGKYKDAYVILTGNPLPDFISPWSGGPKSGGGGGGGESGFG